MESADSRQRIAAGAWGQRHGRPAPSFWCRVLSSPPPSSGKQQFLLLHADAAKFRAQHPLCYGVPLRSQGTPTMNPVTHPPAHSGGGARGAVI